MKKNLQKSVAVALAGAMVAGSLTACNSSSSTDTTTAATQAATQAATTQAANNDTTTAATEATQAPAADVAGIDGWTAFDSKVTLKVPVYDRGAEGVPAIGTGANKYEGWIQENFGDKYNIDVQFVPITRSAVLEAYALLAAADDLPTFLMEYDYPKQAQWAADGYLQEYDLDMFAQVAPNYYERMVNLNQITYTEMDGNRYFVLAERPYFNTNYTFVSYVRMDWLEQVGYDHIPVNREEYLDAMAKIKEAGICEYPGGGAQVTGAGVDQNYAYRSYPLDEELWATTGDYAIPALPTEAQYKLLKFANEDYNLGITNPEYYITTAEEDKAAFVSGNKYSYGGYIAAEVDFLKAFYENNPDGKLALSVQATEPDTAAGTVPALRSNNPFGMMISFSSDANEDEMKAAMMYMEWMLQPENLDFMQHPQNDWTMGFNANKDYWCVAIEAIKAGTIEETITANFPSDLPQSKELLADVIQNYYNQVECWEKGWVPADCMFATNIESVGEYQGDLLSMYEEARNALTMCAPEEFDALYEKWSADYLNAGYQEIIDERAEAYKNGLTTKLPQ